LPSWRWSRQIAWYDTTAAIVGDERLMRSLDMGQLVTYETDVGF
jgi:hypothetical protein